jgi:hypothetical protein
MSFVKELRNFFFDPNRPLNSRGKRINFNSTGEPDQDLMERFASSVPFFTESSDRAKQSTGGEPTEDLIGLVEVETDVLAKANTDGLQAGTTKVTHAGQLPTVGIGPNQAITGTEVPLPADALLDVTPDATATRNNFVVTITAALLGWFQDVSDAIDTAYTNIATNTTDIGTNDTELGNIRTILDVAAIDTDMGDYGPDPNGILSNDVNLRVNLLELSAEIAGIVPGAGEANTASSIGGNEEVFFQKNGIDLEFRTLKSLVAYIDINVGTEVNPGDILTFDFNSALFLTSVIDPTYLKIADKTTVTSVGTGEDIAKPLAGNNYDIKKIKSGVGTVVSTSVDDIVVDVDPAYIQSLIDASSGVVGVPYLFYAEALEEILILSAGLKIKFLNDSVSPAFDNGNTWSVAQWTANSSAVGEQMDFIGEFTIEADTPQGSGGGGRDITFHLVETISAVENVIDTITFDTSSIGAGAPVTIPFTGTTSAIGAIGDSVHLELDSIGFNVTISEWKLTTARSIYNLPA